MAACWAKLRKPLQSIADGIAKPLDAGEVEVFRAIYARTSRPRMARFPIWPGATCPGGPRCDGARDGGTARRGVSRLSPAERNVHLPGQRYPRALPFGRVLVRRIDTRLRNDENDSNAPAASLVSIVTPFFNEGEGVDVYHESLCNVIDRAADVQFEVVCVDDGSRDDTLERLRSVAGKDSRFRIVELSRNFGKESALTAGIELARGDAVIPFDADLQDPPELIAGMIAEWRSGADVVLARRTDRSTDSFLKRTSATWFYRLHNRMSPVELPENVGDFRLMDRAVVDALKNLPEQQRFMKGLFAWVGFRARTIEYARQPRATGKSAFSGWKLWNLALEGSPASAPSR